jgi:hypothetical protein
MGEMAVVRRILGHWQRDERSSDIDPKSLLAPDTIEPIIRFARCWRSVEETEATIHLCPANAQPAGPPKQAHPIGVNRTTDRFDYCGTDVPAPRFRLALSVTLPMWWGMQRFRPASLAA